ncbi:MAG: beta-ketoacyl-[acyl-carrier-protein] synthase family protein [Steroidobacteraceae bacterium]
MAACPHIESTFTELCAMERALFDPVTRYAVHAASEALEQSGILREADVRTGTGVYVGTAMGGMYTIEEAYRDIWYHGTPPKPLAIVCAMANAPASHLSMRFALKGPNITFAVACASSALAIGEALNALRSGRLDCALVGGAEACVTSGVLRAWQAMRVLANVDRSSPSDACRPFSRDRSGIVLGEGAAMLVLERLDCARERGAEVLCELLGFGASSDASHVCIPDAAGQAAAMSSALRDAELSPSDIDYVNAHGTATRVGDIAETQALHHLFGDHACALAVSSTKSAHGHLLGAAGALEFVAGIIALREEFLPATMHLHERDAECDLDYVPNEPREGVRVQHFMSNSFAFGGSNAVLIAGR